MKNIIDALATAAFVVAPLFLGACAETPKPDAPVPATPTAPAASAAEPASPTDAPSKAAMGAVPAARVPGDAVDDLSHATVVATRLGDRVELAVRLPAPPKGHGYDPSLTVGDRTLREYRYEDGDRTLVFVEAEPAKLPSAATASLTFGHGSHVVRKAVLPLVQAPKAPAPTDR